MLKEWFEESIKYDIKIFSTIDSEFIIYKGFKITKIEDNYIIQYVRLNDFYSNVSYRNMKTLKDLGFIKGVDKIYYESISKRIKIYTKKVRFFENKKDNEKISPKKLSFYNNLIQNYTELIFYYKFKIKQYNLLNTKN